MMNKDRASIERTIIEILVEVLGLSISPDEIDEEELLFPQGLDAITPIEIAHSLEKAFAISVEDEELREEMFESVRTLTEYIREKTRISETYLTPLR